MDEKPQLETEVKYLVDFIDQVDVRCPRCSEAAIVFAPGRFDEQFPTVRCGECGFSRNHPLPPEQWMLDAVARRRCRHCGQRHERRFARVLLHKRQVELCCPCGARTSANVSFNSKLLGAPVDPYFRYPLWLSRDVGGHTLWAYNRRHLAFLKEHVEAMLRPTTPGRNSSLVSRLPKWMLKRSRRQNILRAIESL